jgi:hypothetical protein
MMSMNTQRSWLPIAVLALAAFNVGVIAFLASPASGKRLDPSPKAVACRAEAHAQL